MDAYTSGVWDAVAIINEHEDLTLNWNDVLMAAKIARFSKQLDNEEG
tara:strand:+ start:1274 stop:1414 length:141 start_codon:yes stop_codon:yes gene_type:complete